jgi:hypothetical protein
MRWELAFAKSVFPFFCLELLLMHLPPQLRSGCSLPDTQPMKKKNLDF